MKEKFVNFFMSVAEQTAQLSHAKRLKVGAVIVKDKNIISFGYNGMPESMPNECEDMVWHDKGDFIYKTKPEVIHAEANAIAKLARQGGNGQDAIMFITHAPCIECSKLIIQAGIKNVYWGEKYRYTEGLELLDKAGVTTIGEKNA